MLYSTATLPPPASAYAPDLTEDELEVAQLLHLLPNLILQLERRRCLGIPELLRWGHRRRRSLPQNDADGLPPPTEPLRPLPPLEEDEKGGASSKTPSPPSPFQFPGSGYEEDHDSRPAKFLKKLGKNKKDYKKREEEQRSKISALNVAKADLQRAMDEQKKLFQSLSEKSFFLREAERVHQARLRGSMMLSPDEASPVGAAVSGQVVDFSPSPMDPSHLHHKRSEEEQTAGGRLWNAPESTWSVLPAATAGRRGFLIDLNVAAEEMAELAASPAPSLPVPLRPPPPMPSEWDHHHRQQLRLEKAAKSWERRQRRREIQREKRTSSAAAAPSCHRC